MAHLSAYPYPSYTPNRILAGCIAAIVSISLFAWFIQSCQTFFVPVVALFTMGQRMIIVGNFGFVLEIHHEKTRLARGIFLGAILTIIISGALIVPANMFAFESNQIDTSLLFRIVSSSILLAATLLFFWILYWSDTIKDMTTQGVILIVTSSVLCFVVAIFNLMQSVSSDYYNEINSQEGWFYGFEMTPIILAHFTWSILHPKRSSTKFHALKSETSLNTLNSHIES